MDINSLIIFNKVAETNNFSVASRILNIPISTISRKINKLEEDLQHKLLVRSTRKVNLTTDGQLFYNSSKLLFNDINDLENIFSNDNDISGEIRVTCTIEHKHFLIPHVIEFRKKYPKINLFFNFSNDVQDMIENSFDFAFRAGNLKNSNMYAYNLYSDTFNAYIHKKYYKKDITFNTLSDFDCCMMKNFPIIKTVDGQTFKPEEKIVSNSIEFILDYSKNYPTVTYLPYTHVSEDFVKLDFFESYHTNFQLVYLHKKLNKPCSLFLDFFKNKDFDNFRIFS